MRLLCQACARCKEAWDALQKARAEKFNKDGDTWKGEKKRTAAAMTDTPTMELEAVQKETLQEPTVTMDGEGYKVLVDSEGS